MRNPEDQELISKLLKRLVHAEDQIRDLRKSLHLNGVTGIDLSLADVAVGHAERMVAQSFADVEAAGFSAAAIGETRALLKAFSITPTQRSGLSEALQRKEAVNRENAQRLADLRGGYKVRDVKGHVNDHIS